MFIETCSYDRRPTNHNDVFGGHYEYNNKPAMKIW